MPATQMKKCPSGFELHVPTDPEKAAQFRCILCGTNLQCEPAPAAPQTGDAAETAPAAQAAPPLPQAAPPSVLADALAELAADTAANPATQGEGA